jgi:hypothetical protein
MKKTFFFVVIALVALYCSASYTSDRRWRSLADLLRLKALADAMSDDLKVTPWCRKCCVASPTYRKECEDACSNGLGMTITGGGICRDPKFTQEPYTFDPVKHFGGRVIQQ